MWEKMIAVKMQGSIFIDPVNIDSVFVELLFINDLTHTHTRLILQKTGIETSIHKEIDEQNGYYRHADQ